MSRCALPVVLVALQGCISQPSHPVTPGTSRGTVVTRPQPGSAAEPERGDAASVPQPQGPGDEQTDSRLAMDRPITERPVAREPHPLADVSDDELEAMLRDDPSSLGSASLGRTSAGALWGGVQMPEGDRWKVVHPREAWATQETIDFLIRCIDAVHAAFPDTEPIHIGDLSAREGGHLAPHLSHQSGRDVDIGYYYTTPHKWYMHADRSNLDVARTWTFVRAMITETDVEWIFIDREIQKLLREHALSVGEDEAWLDHIFEGEGEARPLILHEPGHDTHIHIRFYNPIAQETGRRLYPKLVAAGEIDPPTYYVKHKIGRRDTLIRIAKKYGTSVNALKKANGLRSSRIYRGRILKIPRRGGVAQASEPVQIPARRLPPVERTVANPGAGSDEPGTAAAPEP